MSMSLTLSQPAKADLGSRSTIHDCVRSDPIAKLSKNRVASPVRGLRASTTTAITSADEYSPHRHHQHSTSTTMSTPHRGLPPPSALMSDPSRHSLDQPLGALPAPPSQWHGQDESMRDWLSAKAEEEKRKAEEEKRKQEEERTKQESLRIEQRRIEQSMLRESLQAGVPPQMVPIIYAGLGGSKLANTSLEWLQQHTAQQQQQQQSPPEHRRESRPPPPGTAAAPAFTVVQQPPTLASQPAEPPPPQTSAPLQTTFAAFPPATNRPPPSSHPRSATHTQLPRLTTNEMFVHQPPTTAQTTTHADAPPKSATNTAASPSIYFHHWIPPQENNNSTSTSTSNSNSNSNTTAKSSSHTSTSGGGGSTTNPQTPASKPSPASGPSTDRTDHRRDSPRKRKATGAHAAVPMPPAVGARTWASPLFGSAGAGGRRSPGVGGREREREREGGR